MMIRADQDYALRALICLARAEGRMSSLEIAQATKASRQYLIQIFQRLRNAGIVDAKPGKDGGYAISTDPAGIAVAQVFDALREPQNWSSDAWASACVAAEMRTALDGITIGDLALASLQARKEQG